jgi:hypothetical protein
MDVSSELDKTRRLDNGTAATFKYTETFENHFLYRHAVDDHNNRENRVFAFILAISEVNAWLAFWYFGWTTPKERRTLIQFRRRLAKELIYNPHRVDTSSDGESRASMRGPHIRKSATARDACKTRGCNKKIKTYSKCMPWHWMCLDCWEEHLRDTYSANSI